MTERNALDGIVDVVVNWVSPLVVAAHDEGSLLALLDQMGWSVADVDLDRLGEAATSLMDTLEGLRSGVSTESLNQLVETLDSLSTVTVSLKEYASGLAEAVGATGADPVLGEVVQALAGDLLQHLTLIYLGRRPALYGAMRLLGLIDQRFTTPLATSTTSPVLQRAPVIRPVLAVEALGPLFTDPLEVLKSGLGVRELDSQQAAEQAAVNVIGRLLDFVVLAGGTGVVGAGDIDPPNPTADEIAARRRGTLVLGLPSMSAGGTPVRYWLTVTVELVHSGAKSSAGDAGPGVLLIPEGTLQFTSTLPGSQLDLRLEGDASSLYLPAVGRPVLHGGAEELTLTVEYTSVPTRVGSPAVALGADSARLTVAGLSARAAARVTVAEDLHVEVAVDADRAHFQLSPTEGDGFLSTVLPAEGIGFDFDLGIGWSNGRGVYFTGGAGLQADLPLDVDLFGLVTLDVLHLGLAANGPTIAAHVATTATLRLGPFTATVERLGLAAELTQKREGGNLGPLNVVPRFLPPKGAGLAIDLPAVSGGGFLSFDADAGRYAGVFELTIVNTVSVKVIGIITTKLADGSPGFALLLIITAEGFTPIQLGMGFALTGVGGLLALNRSIDADAVRDGLSSGVLDSVLFVKDPVKNAPRILSTLDRVFPLAQDRFLVGPLAEISWGPGGLVKIRLALLLEVPQPVRVVLLAAIGVVLPDPKAPVVELHVDAIGVLDFGRGELALDASLHDSRILSFTLTGDMALRLNWGRAPSFLMAVGGFHPRFTPPAGLRPLNRLALTLTDGENPRIRFETYLAVTSNTIQMGARVEVYAELGGFGIDGGGAFDALVQWSPFAVDASFEAWVRVFRGTVTLLAARVAFAVTGPEPWHVTGVAEVAFLGLSARVPVDFSIGGRAEPPRLEAVDVARLLWDQAGQRSAWDAALPAGVAPGVTLGQPTADGDGAGPPPLVVHPLSRLTLRQKVVPLGTPISRVGARLPIEGTRQYEFDVATAAGLQVQPVKELFAPAQYADLSDDEKLTGAAFKSMQAGLSMLPNTDAVAASEGVISTEVIFESRTVTARGQPGLAGARVPAVAESAVHGAPGAQAVTDRSRMRATWAVVPG